LICGCHSVEETNNIQVSEDGKLITIPITKEEFQEEFKKKTLNILRMARFTITKD